VALHLAGLGCARNDADSEELAARFAAAGFDLVGSAEAAEVVVVNTCGFIEAAKQESIDTLLAAADLKQSGHLKAVVAAGCLAERYGAELADALPEADAVVGFDGYADIARTVQGLLSGGPAPSVHAPRDRRLLLPLAPAERSSHAAPAGPPTSAAPALTSAAPPFLRRRLNTGPSAPLKIATGCDRRCAFCAIPFFRGAFQSRPAADIVSEARWLAGEGVKELFLVSENTTSYGKDLGRPDALPRLLRELGVVDGVEWIRLSYLQPAEVRPGLIDAIAGTPKVVPYFDLPFQHAARHLLRRMRRFGDAASFLTLIAQIRQAAPDAGIRTNVIVGFPGETEADLQELADFLAAADLDAIGVFGYSDEEGTEGAGLAGHLSEAEIADRAGEIAALADVVTAERSRRWVGRTVDVLVEAADEAGWRGRTPAQGPEADGETFLEPAAGLAPGVIARAVIRDTDGVDLMGAAETAQM
jgi:ribosomal protein S12 methylthiotransferase RimO